MKTILFAASKGGPGKSTIATNLAPLASGAGRVLLVDLDPQQSMRSWWDVRPTEDIQMLPEDPEPKDLSRVLDGVRDHFDFCLVDTPGREVPWMQSAMEAADLVVIPVRPSRYDTDAIAATYGIAQRAGTPYVFVMSQVPRTALARQASRAVGGSGRLAPVDIRYLPAAYPETASTGLGVTETPGSSGAGEIRRLWDYLREVT